MIISQIEAKNFFTFEHVLLPLENLRGLWLVEGRNLDESGSDDNGSGKSALMTETISVCLFGRSIRYGKQLDNVVREGQEDCMVRNVLRDGDRTLEVVRYRKDKKFKNNLYLGVNGGKLESVTQEAVERALGIDYQSFMATTMVSQEEVSSFSAATDADKKAIMEKILGLERLSAAQDIAKTNLKSEQGKLALVNQKVQNLEDRIRDQELTILGIERKLKEEKESKDKAITEAASAVSVVNGKRAVMRSRVATSETAVAEKLKALEEERKPLTESVNEMAALRKDTDISAAELRTKTSSVNRELSRLNGEKTNVTSRIGRDCPTCGKPITKDDMAAVLSGIETQLAERNKELSALTAQKTELDEVYTELKGADQELENRKKSVEAFNKDWQNAADTLTEEKGELKTLERELQLAEKNLANLKSGPSQMADLLKQEQDKLAKYRKDLEESSAGVAAQELLCKDLEFWVTGFGNSGMKSFLMENVIPVLNEYANRYSQMMTDGSIRIKFNAQTPNKDGTLREKFDVSAENQFGAAMYAGNSSGEKKRVDLCTLMALQKAGSKKSIRQNIHDEVTSYLDERGNEKYVQLLKSEMRNGEMDAVFVITHNDEIRPFADGILTVEKKNGVSRLIREGE